MLNGAISDGQGVGWITNDDPNPTVSVNNPTVLEGNAGTTTTLVFTVSLSSPSGQQTTVNYTTASGSEDPSTHQSRGVLLHNGDLVRLLGGYSHGGVPGALYRYTPLDPTDTPRLDLGSQDYGKGPWTRVQTNLSKENFNDTSRWVKETSIEAVAVAD